MGVKEKVPRPTRVTQSGHEANKNVLQEKEERSKSTINIILDEGHKKVNGKGGFATSKISDDLLVPDKNATENPELLAFLRGTLGPEMPVAPFTRTQPNLEADWSRDQYLAELARIPIMRELGRLPLPCDKRANVQLTRLAAARSQIPLCSCGVMAKCVSFSHVLMRRTGWKQSN